MTSREDEPVNSVHTGPRGSQAPGVPAEEGVDEASVQDDLAESPEEKRNATDGYAPADDED